MELVMNLGRKLKILQFKSIEKYDYEESGFSFIVSKLVFYVLLTWNTIQRMKFFYELNALNQSQVKVNHFIDSLALNKKSLRIIKYKELKKKVA